MRIVKLQLDDQSGELIRDKLPALENSAGGLGIFDIIKGHFYVGKVVVLLGETPVLVEL